MKAIRYTTNAQSDLRTYRAQARLVMEKVKRYAETGAGDVKMLQGDAAQAAAEGWRFPRHLHSGR